MGAQVTLFDRGIAKIAAIDRIYRGRISTCVADPLTLERAVADADLVIGAVLIPGKLSPKFVSRALLRKMRPGSVIVDVGIDQGGIAETSRPTSHSAPIFVEEGVIHYCVPNMPSAVARTATLALTQATLPYALQLANLGLRRALEKDAGLMQGLQVHAGKLTHAGLAEDTKRPFTPPAEVLS
jgi:alanine dehydrogenase